MKKILFTIIAGMALQTSLVAQPKEIKSEARISEVTVYTNGARIFSDKKVDLNAGNHVVKFTGISPEIDPGSIQVTAEGAVTILTVNHELDFLSDTEQSTAIKNLEKQRDLVIKKSDKEKMQLEVLDKEMQFLQANMKVTSTQITTKVSELAPVYDYFTAKTAEITLGKKWRNDSVKVWAELINKYNKQIADLQAQQNKPIGVIAVNLDAAEKTSVLFRVSYIVNNAGWFPTYDVRVKNIDSPVQLAYKANVYQRSGVDWKDVILRFSSANAFQTGVLPELNPWVLDFTVPRPMLRETVKGGNMLYMKSAEAMDQSLRATSTPLEMNTMEQLTTVEFVMEKTFSVPASGKNLQVEIQRVSIPATYSYISVPKLDPAAHLKAKLTNWEQFNLMAGEANVYYEGSFTGKTYINTADFADTLELSLGIDRNIQIQRIQEKEFSSSRFLASKTESTKSWKLTVRNNKSQKINITLLDQVPLPANSEIEVTDIQLSGAKYEPATGIVTWNFDVKPTEKVEKKLSYTVKYPKGKKLNLE